MGRLNPGTAAAVIALAVAVVGGVYFYMWQFTGKEKSMSAAEAMEAGKRAYERGEIPKAPPKRAQDLVPGQAGRKEPTMQFIGTPPASGAPGVPARKPK